MTKEDRKNAYLYCKFRDEQFALYDEYAKRHGMMMKTLLVVNVLFYAKEGLTQTEICQRTFQSKQTVNVIIKSLLEDQYVTVAEMPENRRFSSFIRVKYMSIAAWNRFPISDGAISYICRSDNSSPYERKCAYAHDAYSSIRVTLPRRIGL